MEYHKIILLPDNTPNQPTKLRTKNGLKKMIMHVECITPKVKLNLKLQCYNQVYVVIVMYISL